jgi:hypothetical protein
MSDPQRTTCPAHLDLHDRLRAVEQWKKGNGAVGAEDRIQMLEEKAVVVEKSGFITKKEAKEMQDDLLIAVKDAMKGKYSGLRAFAPYFAALMTALVAVLAILIKSS